MKFARRVIFAVVLFGLLSFAQAAAGVYAFSRSVDYSGPYAAVMKEYEEAATILLAWWNESVGRKIGVKIVKRCYDTRYDPALIARLWPRILSRDRPLVHLGMGGSDVVALMPRLPDDSVPMILSTGAYGLDWLPGLWIFHTRPTYAHEVAGFIEWYKKVRKGSGPLRVAAVSSQMSPAYVDMVEGVKSYAASAGGVEFVGCEWVKIRPVSLISEVRRLARKKPHVIVVLTNTAQALGVVRAERALGVHIPVVLSSHNGLQMCARAAGTMKELEGHYDVYSMDPGIHPISRAVKIFYNYRRRLGLKSRWSLMSVQAFVHMLLALRAVERAVSAVGPDEITGRDIYKAMFAGPFRSEELLSLSPDISFDKDRPFPKGRLRVRITTVLNGVQVEATSGWVDVPEVPRWTEPR